MKKTFNILFPVLITFFSCSKHYEDYSYLNTDRRPQVIIHSQRYTDHPPVNLKGEWIPYKIVYDSLSKDVDYRAYENIPPDTIYSSCSIDKIDSLFRIEIMFFEVFKK